MQLNHFNKWAKRAIALISDTVTIVISMLGALWLSTNASEVFIPLPAVIKIIMIQCSMYIYCGLYRGIWRFASIPDLIRILRTVILGTAFNLILLRIDNITIPINICINYILLMIILLSASRILFRWYRDYFKLYFKGQRVLVVGAGSAGEGLIRDLYRSSLIHQYIPVAFVDDNVSRHGSEVHGVRVLGACERIPEFVIQHQIDLILIAIPSASSKQLRQLVNYCEKSKAPFRTLPSLKNITDGVVKVSSLRSILLEDLLGREVVNHDNDNLKSFLTDSTILITGGGGSIGAELCRQVCEFNPKKLIIVDHSEFNLYTIDMELQKSAAHIQIHAHLCNITDRIEMQKLFVSYRPDFVFHVAAYKHVPLIENHLRVSMYNNIIGTQIVSELADRYAVKTFALISTDKAVNPTSIMGATKRAAEIICQTLNKHSSTRFITVRFGNVLDSAGSVIPLFRKQLSNGGPITVTHPHITRYFMTIPEAAQLILQATAMQNQGEIFVLDMGEPINIRYLAEQMIKLSGKIIGQDIEIKYTGLRAGEKLHEELFHANEEMYETLHPKIKQAKVRSYDWQPITEIMTQMELACQHDDEGALMNLLTRLVPEYKKAEADVTDTVTKAKEFAFN